MPKPKPKPHPKPKPNPKPTPYPNLNPNPNPKQAAFSYSTVAAGALGVAAGAAHQVCLQLWFATSLLADAIAIAAQPLLATCLAQRERSGARKVVRQSLLLGAAAGLATAAALALLGPALCRLFTKDPAALAAAAEVWPLVVASQPLNTLAFSVDGLLYGKPDPNPDPHPHPHPNPNPNPNQARATSTTARS